MYTSAGRQSEMLPSCEKATPHPEYPLTSSKTVVRERPCNFPISSICPSLAAPRNQHIHVASMSHGLVVPGWGWLKLLGFCCSVLRQTPVRKGSAIEVQGIDIIFKSGRGEKVDAADLKSASRKGVRVRVPPSAPNCFKQI